MKKFLVMIAVATAVVFQGFAQKVNPWLRGENNKTTEEVRSYWLDGVVPQGITATLPHDEVVRAIEQSFGNAGIKEDWAVVVLRSKCVDPPVDLKKRTIRFWGSLGGKAKLMDQPRELRKDEQIFVDPKTNFILGGCQCANLLDVPMAWNEPLCLPEPSLDSYSTVDDPLPPDTVRIKRVVSRPASGQNPASASASVTVDSRTNSSSSDECTWCGNEDRDEYIRMKDVRNYLTLRDEDVHSTNNENIRVDEAQARIRRDDMINMMIARNMCNDCQPTGRETTYDNTQYYEVRQGNQNAWLAPFLGGLAGGFGGGVLSELVFNNRGGRPFARQWNGWQQQSVVYGNRNQPPPQGQGWEQTVGNNGWNSNGAVGLGGFVPNNGR